MVLTIKLNLRERKRKESDVDGSTADCSHEGKPMRGTGSNSTNEPSTSRKTSSSQCAKHAKTYREKIKSDPEAWAKFKEEERRRHQKHRAARTEKQKRHDRETGRVRQQRYAARKKAAILGEGEKKNPKVLTRSEKQKKREYNRIKKRESRQRMTPQQKRRMREKDAKRKREKRLWEKNKQKRTKKTPETPSTGQRSSGFTTPAAKKMALSRLWEKVPKDPEKFGDIVEDFLIGRRTTPRKQAVLEKRGLIPYGGSRKKSRLFQEIMATAIRKSVQDLKRKKDAASLRDRRVILTAARICKKYRMQSHLAPQLDVRPAYIRKLPASTHHAASTERKRRSDATSIDVIEEVREFYQSPRVSRELPYMKTVTKQIQRRVMEVSVAQAYNMWKEDNNNNRVVSLSLFQKLRPENVLLQGTTKLNQCLCETCTNIMLKLRSVNRAAQAFSMPEVKVRDKYHLIELSMCTNEGKYAKKECINRNCSMCGVHLLRDRFSKLEDHGQSMIHWLKWETQKYEHDGRMKSKKVMVNQRKTIQVMLQELQDETETLAKHLFVANWQQDQFTKLCKNLPQKWVLLVLDFAENYSCISQDEIQSAHWATQQVTVHPIVAYYHCTHPDTIMPKSHIAQEALVFISDDLLHDHHAVHHFEQQAIRHLRDNRGLQINHCVEFTDGCAAQYKARGPFADVSFAKVDYGVDFERSFFGSRHGKGPSDGVSGVVKSTVRLAVISRRALVNTAEDMFDYCKTNMSLDVCDKQRRSFFLVRKTEVERERSEREVQAAVPGTRSFHSVRCVRPGVIDTRQLSCFCDGCTSDPPESCTMSVAPWQRRTLKMIRAVSDAGNGDTEVPAQVVDELEGDDDQPPKVLDISLTDILQTLSGTTEGPKVHENADLNDEPQSQLHLDPEVLDACLSINQMINTPGVQDEPQIQGQGSTSIGECIKDCSDIEVNNYVAVRFDAVRQTSKAQVYMAMVTEKSNGYLRVKFMRKKAENRYNFTHEESTHPIGDVQMVMTQPTLVVEGRALLYEFRVEELDELTERFTLK